MTTALRNPIIWPLSRLYDWSIAKAVWRFAVSTEAAMRALGLSSRYLAWHPS